MKSSAFLINTARGGVIVEQDVADALNEKIIAGEGIDVQLSLRTKFLILLYKRVRNFILYDERNRR